MRKNMERKCRVLPPVGDACIAYFIARICNMRDVKYFNFYVSCCRVLCQGLPINSGTSERFDYSLLALPLLVCDDKHKILNAIT